MKFKHEDTKKCFIIAFLRVFVSSCLRGKVLRCSTPTSRPGYRRHRTGNAYGCFLPDLTRFAADPCIGPDHEGGVERKAIVVRGWYACNSLTHFCSEFFMTTSPRARNIAAKKLAKLVAKQLPASKLSPRMRTAAAQNRLPDPRQFASATGLSLWQRSTAGNNPCWKDPRLLYLHRSPGTQGARR